MTITKRSATQSNKLKIQSLIAIALCLLCFNATAQLYFTDADDLADAVNSTTTGGTFIVTNGTYNDFEAFFKKSAFVTLKGFVFDGQGEDSLVKLEGCNNIRISRNVFELETTESIKWVFVGGVWNDNTFPFQWPSHHNRIDHNIFQNKETPGHYITIDGSFDDTGSDEVYYQSQYDRIDYNYFKNNGPRAVNEQESIRIGWSEMSLSSGFTTVAHNLFEDCDGDPEIVSVKSCDNIIKHNTFVASYGTLSLRHGNRNRVEGNYFFGDEKPIGTSPAGSTIYTGGIRVYGTDHVIINNYMEGLNGTRWDAPITLTLGDAIDGQSSSLSKHFRAERVTIAHNTLVNNSHGIEIGFDNNDNYNKNLKDITIANNLITGAENSLVEIVDTDNDQGDEITWLSNLMYPTGDAMLLAGATSTTLGATAVSNEHPFLIFDEDSNTWRTTAETPLYENAIAAAIISEDIDGQERPSTSNPGADHYSMESIRYIPLTPEEVGPNASYNASTAVTDKEILSGAILYPNPTNNVLYLSDLDRKVNELVIMTLEGQVLLSNKIKSPLSDLTIDTSTLPNGIYLVQLLNDKAMEVRKVIIQH